jgi:hypothetical protein
MQRALDRWFAFAIAVVLGIALTAGPSPVRAFPPPTDQAGPLVVRIDGPGEVTRIDTPVPVRVRIENQGDSPVQGTVELKVIDRWTASPAGPLSFSIAPRAAESREFTVQAGKGTYEAHYPIHAYARFVHEGKPVAAHPILIVPTRLGTPPEAQTQTPPEWKPYRMTRTGERAVWQLPARRAVVQVFGQGSRTMPPGWQGSEPTTGAVVEVRSQAIGPDRHEVLMIHPPYRDGRIGTALAEFPLVLPKTRPITLRFANAVTSDGQGDGVTFRIRVLPFDAPPGQLGAVVFERHSAAKDRGEPGAADLGRYAGRTIRLQLESHPGPRNNTSWDQSFWIEPTLVAGTPARPAPFPPTGSAGSIALGTVRVGQGQGQGQGQSQSEAAVRVWPGARGLLDAAVGIECPGHPVYFRGFEVRVLGTRLDDPRSPIGLAAVRAEHEQAAGAGAYRVRHEFQGPAGTFTLIGQLTVESGVVRAHFHLEDLPPQKPWQATYLEAVALGPWSRPARQVYAGHGNVVRDPEAFALEFDGHKLATSFIGIDFRDGPSVVQGVDVPPARFEVNPGERHYSIEAPHALTFTLIAAENVFDAAKVWRTVNGLKPADGVARAAGRFVFDLWSGHYADSARLLRQSFRYGLTDTMVVWHNWQRFGYDYRLPDIYPPSPQLGTEDQLKDLIAACKSAGTLFALHDNYIDFYPDADEFSYERNIAFSAGGRPVKAWLNEGRGAQSYRYRADRAAPYLKRNLELIRANLAPTAYFIDVWSSIQPYDYWTSDGLFRDRADTRTTWGELFAWIRNELGDHAPQLSESGHDQLIGWLDGAQTNHFRVGPPVPVPVPVPGSDHGWTIDWRCADAERTPWFDTAHHDRFILHGAGYSTRYAGGLDPRLHGIDSDDYIATEVLTGHPAMVSEPFGRAVVRKHWLLNDLMRALALRTIEAVEYVGDDLHRQHVRWSGGGEVWVNRGDSDWTIAGQGQVLPPYGFLARVPTGTGSGIVEASITRRAGLIMEEARSQGQFYVNGRLLMDGPARIRPEVVAFQGTTGGGFDLTLQWRADDPIPPGFQPFLHFCDEAGKIVFQARHEPATFDGDGERERSGLIRATAKGQVPAGVEPGTTFELRAGLYNPDGGPRLALTGPADGESRIRLGRLRVKEKGGLVWTPHPAPAEPDPVLARQNPEGTPIDFGPLTTAGGVRLTRDGQALVITPLPGARERERNRRFEVAVRPSALPWPVALAEPAQVEAVADDGKVLTRTPARRQGESLSVTCEPGVFQYRLTGK